MIADVDTPSVISVKAPKKADIRTIRLLISCGLCSMILFIAWFTKPEHIGFGPIYWLLTFALGFKLLKMLHEWYHYWSPGVPVPPEIKTKWKVDVLTTYCPGEPKDMIIRTLKAMVAIKYPHTNYLCDEGDDPFLRSLCKELGVIHVTRKEKTDAKAGNINNALKQATGDICVVLDPDHEPIPEFLDRTLPYFEDPKIGFVQCVQGYHNQNESIIALGAAEQTYHFYGPMMMCMNTYGTAQAIGANCTFRRKALDSIGGHAPGLSEDMHTAMQLHAKGWKSVYIPEILTRGLVPATLSSYYQQQLKWSRGTFELLFRTFPSLYKNFTWRQKVHYFTLPLYFLFGLITFIDILVPILSLCLAQVPWEVEISRFGVYFLSLLSLSMIIRLYAQRWLLEKHERGLHLAGGLLRTATWWIFLIGFIYSILNIRVPYIPTPKEDEHQNFIKLSIPNFLSGVICGLAIVYGLTLDWSPYSMAMAFYAVLNAVILGFVVIMSQQKFLSSVKNFVKTFPVINQLEAWLRSFSLKTQNLIFKGVHNGPAVLLTGGSLLFVSYMVDDNSTPSSVITDKTIGGFYSGVTIPKNDKALKTVTILENTLHTSFEIMTVTEKWNPEGKVEAMPLMQSIKEKGAMPLIFWEPDIKQDKLCIDISSGKYNSYLESFALEIRKFSQPVFISFAPGFDDPEKSWSVAGNNTAEEFVKAWQHVYSFFTNLGISNVTWVWNPRYPFSTQYYPGEKFVDWIGIPALNYAKEPANDDWYTFSQLYTPYRNKLGVFQKPVIITELGAVNGSNQTNWFSEALADIKSKFSEIKSVVICNSKKEFPILIKETGELTNYCANFTLNGETVMNVLAKKDNQHFHNKPFIKSNFDYFSNPDLDYSSSFIKGKPGHFSLLINGQPYYVRGVAYNTAHDWRDGNMPLTRRQLEKDFKKIKAMGANTLRRYDHGLYDRNVLNIAEEYDLKVLFGFWFDPKVDFYRDSNRVNEYMNDVIESVLKFKDHPSVMAWALGNETWGLLKHKYSKPYLIKVRQHYVKMIETLAQRIHQIDPSRPIFSCMEHEEYQIAGELVAFRDAAPSIDVIGVNSYYEQQIKRLNHTTWEFDSLRPYIVSEFGPRGYWDPVYNRTVNGTLIEDKESEKADWYKKQWNTYVYSHKGYNVGGFAYCWHDRMEGSNTWFGLTDYKGRPKPSYFALKELWTSQRSETLPEFTINVPDNMLAQHNYTITASASSKCNEELEYEWYMHRNEFLKRINNITVLDKGKIVIEMPKENANYRLYLYVSDKKGNVTTASVPIRVK